MQLLRSVLARLGGGGGSRTEDATRALGRRGERAAGRLLRREGYRILGRNVRVRIGEADIVCVDPDGRTIVIVEVKTRRVSAAVGAGERRAAPAPEMSITRHKQRKLLAVARYLAKANRWTGRPVRIDVVAVDWPPSGAPVLRHRKNAVVRDR